MNIGDVWWVRFPYDDDPHRFKVRPAIVLDDAGSLGVLSVKVTTHDPRQNDIYDVEIFEWSEAGLKLASTARISKTIILEQDNFLNQIGTLTQDDLDNVLSSYMNYRNQ